MIQKSGNSGALLGTIAGGLVYIYFIQPYQLRRIREKNK